MIPIQMRGAALLGPIASSNFLTSTALPSWLTLTRSGHATMFDSAGKLTFAPNNLLTYSNDFTNTGWTDNWTLTATGRTNPVGRGTASLFTMDAVPQGNGIRKTGVAGAAVAGYAYLISFCFKSANHQWWEATTVHGGATRSWFDATNRTTGTVNHPSMTVTPVGSDGWMLVTYKTAVLSSALDEVYLTPRSANGNPGGITAAGTEQVEIASYVIERVTYETSARTWSSAYETTSAAYYGPRFDYDPATLDVRGLLIEESRTNLCLASETMSTGTPWFALSGAIGVTDNAATAPTGVAVAEKLIASNTSSAEHGIYQSSITVGSTSTNTFSVFLKAAEYNWAMVAINDAGDNGTWFNTSTGAMGTTFGTLVSKGSEAIGNGWYRVWVTRTAPGTSATPYFGFSDADKGSGDGRGSFAATTNSGIYAFGAQLEAGSFATSYIPTTTSALPRVADSLVATGQSIPSTGCAGVLEYEDMSPATQSDKFSFGTGAIANGYFLYGDVTTTNLTQRAASSSVRTISPSNGTVSNIFRIVFSRKGASIYLSVNGATPGSDGTTVADPATPLTTVKILGTHSFYGTASNGWVRKTSIYNVGLTSAQVASLSALSTSYTFIWPPWLFTRVRYN